MKSYEIGVSSSEWPTLARARALGVPTLDERAPLARLNE